MVWTVTNHTGDIGEEMVAMDNQNEQVEVLEEKIAPSELTNTGLFTIPEEEEPIHSSIPVEIENPPEESEHLPVATVAGNAVITLHVSNIFVETFDAVPHCSSPTRDSNRDDLPIVSQESYDSDDETNKTIFSECFDSDKSATINEAFDPDVEAPEITSILAYQFNGGKLEFLCKYATGNKEWHPIDLVKNNDPLSVANYIMQNDLGKPANNIHWRWVQLFLQTV